MTLRFRRWLFVSFTLIFIVMAGLILPYAFGYKFSSNGLRLQRTGMFVIETKPSGAKIYLNDKLQTSSWTNIFNGEKNLSKTPIKISHLEPGEYLVRLELEGYWPWEKKLLVKASETTYLEDVRLFKQNLPQLLVNLPTAEIKEASLSPDNNLLAIAEPKRIKLIDLNTLKETSYNNDFQQKMVWSADSSKLLLDQAIIDITKSTINPLKPIPDKQVSALNWANESSELICYLDKSGLNFLNLSNQKISSILPYDNKHNVTISDCLIKKNLSYVISQENNKTNLSIINIDNGEKSGFIELPHTADYRFENYHNKWLNILDKNNGKLSLIEDHMPWSKDYTIKTLSHAAIYSHWIDHNKILTANEFEIWINDLRDDSQKLLTRISQPISNIFWHPSKNYIIYLTDKSIKALELDDRERYNITELLTIDSANFSNLGVKGNNLYFIGRIGNQSGYWRLEL